MRIALGGAPSASAGDNLLGTRNQPASPPQRYDVPSIPLAKRTRFLAIRSIVEPRGWSLTR